MLHRTRKPYVVIAFPTTAAAFQLESRAKAQGFTGRLIPVPREITAGCGLAWRDTPEQQAALVELLQKESIPCDAVRVLTL